MNNDYDHLLDKKIKFYNFIGRVVGCDLELGITLVNDKNPTDYLFCLHGPLSKAWDEDGDRYLFDRKEYEKLFLRYVNQLKRGTLTLPYLLNSIGKGAPSAERCPFAQ